MLPNFSGVSNIERQLLIQMENLVQTSWYFKAKSLRINDWKKMRTVILREVGRRFSRTGAGLRNPRLEKKKTCMYVFFLLFLKTLEHQVVEFVRRWFVTYARLQRYSQSIVYIFLRLDS